MAEVEVMRKGHHESLTADTGSRLLSVNISPEVNLFLDHATKETLE